MTVELIAVLVCDECGVTRGHEYANDILRATRELRRSARNLRGWTAEVHDGVIIDKCLRCNDIKGFIP